MLTYVIGYKYKQKYNFAAEDGNNRTGYTPRIVLHALDENGDIIRTYDYKTSGFDCSVGDRVGSPFFDRWKKVVGFAPLPNGGKK